MKKYTKCSHTAICLLCAFLFFFHPAQATKNRAPHGVVSVQIDPLKNRLTVYDDGVPFKTFPIALGKPETPTPVGDWTVIHKAKNWEVWFGTRWIGLSVPWGNYGIHGTNKPGSIGKDASHGCVRMFNRDVEELYEWVKIGTHVTIIGHPLREPALDPRQLANGDSGVDVLLVQNRLRAAGYFLGNCNGKFGDVTERAMKSFEKANHLQIDGVVSMKDYRALGLIE